MGIGSQESIQGLISYAHLEKIPSTIDSGSYDDLNSTFDKMPRNTFSDLDSKKTFEDIPSDVFEQIPRYFFMHSLFSNILSTLKNMKPVT